MNQIIYEASKGSKYYLNVSCLILKKKKTLKNSIFALFQKKNMYIKQKQKEIENNKQIQEMVQKLSFANQSILQHYGIDCFVFFRF